MGEFEMDEVTFMVEGRLYTAKRGKVAMSSTFFLNLLNSSFKESTQNVIELPISDPFCVFPHILDYIHNGTEFVTLENMVGTLALAQFFRIQSLVDAVERAACLLKEDNLNVIIDDLARQPPTKLTPSLLKHLSVNFLSAIRNEKLSTLPPCIVIPMLEDFPHTALFPSDFATWISGYLEHTVISTRHFERICRLRVWEKITDKGIMTSIKMKLNSV